LILGDFALPHGNQDDAASNHHDCDSVPKAEQIWFKPQFSCLPGSRGRSQLAERAWKSPSSSVALRAHALDGQTLPAYINVGEFFRANAKLAVDIAIAILC